MPTLISVSMVAAPWRRFCQAARWNGQPAQNTTGVASWSASHCQLSNCSAGIIAIASTGSVRTVAAISRLRSARVGSSRTSSGAAAGAPAGRGSRAV